MVDIENDYFDKDGLVDDKVDKKIIEYDGDEMKDKGGMTYWMMMRDTN